MYTVNNEILSLYNDDQTLKTPIHFFFLDSGSRIDMDAAHSTLCLRLNENMKEKEEY